MSNEIRKVSGGIPKDVGGRPPLPTYEATLLSGSEFRDMEHLSKLLNRKAASGYDCNTITVVSGGAQVVVTFRRR